MSLFKIEIIRTDRYKVTVDEAVWTASEIASWASSFYPAETTKDIAERLAKSVMKLGSDYGFMEGFGYVKMFYADGRQKNLYTSGFRLIEEEEYTKGVSVTLIDEDDDYEVECDNE